MFCNKCGNELMSGAKYCQNCGSKLEFVSDDISEGRKNDKLVQNIFVKWLITAIVSQCALFILFVCTQNDIAGTIYFLSFIPTLILSIMCIVKSKHSTKNKGKTLGIVFTVLNAIASAIIIASLISVFFTPNSSETNSSVTKSYNLDTDMSLATTEALEYCDMLEQKYDNITSVELTDNVKTFGEGLYYFECRVKSNNYKTRYGTISVCKIDSDRFEVLNMKYNDEN